MYKVDTTINALGAAAEFYGRGIKGNLTQKELQRTVKVFNKIRDDVQIFKQAVQKKYLDLAVFKAENKDDALAIAKREKEIDDEMDEISKVSFEVTNDDLEILKTVIDAIEWKDSETKSGTVLGELQKFREALENACTT